MTLSTIGDIAVSIHMTEVTGKGFMHARARSHLFAGTGVTGDTNNLVFAIKIHIQRLMGIMATETVVDFIVSAAIVTVTASRDIVGRAGTMSFMTRLAINFSLVRSAVSSDLGRLLSMALYTVINSQNRLRNSHGTERKKSDSNNKQGLQLNIKHLSLPPLNK